jgi:hypothetical protein
MGKSFLLNIEDFHPKAVRLSPQPLDHLVLYYNVLQQDFFYAGVQFGLYEILRQLPNDRLAFSTTWIPLGVMGHYPHT